MGDVSWGSPLSAVAGKDAAKHAAKIIKETGLATVGDLLLHFPRAYVPKGNLSDLGQLVEGSMLSLVGKVIYSKLHTYQDKRTKKSAYRLEVQIEVENGSLALTFFDKYANTAQWREQDLAVGRVGMFSGRVKWFNRHWQLTNPDSRMFGQGADHTERSMPELIPIYSQTGGISTWHLEDTIAFALHVIDRIPERLPDDVRREQDLVSAAEAVKWIHRPNSHAQLTLARKRLKFDEAFVTQLVLARRRALLENTPAVPRPGLSAGLLDDFDARLPFTLTSGQDEIGREIATELGRSHPMHRLLQGEVGSGKTLVALRAMLQVVDSGGQAALLAPTEVLAQQHLRSITTMLGDLGMGGELGAAEHATRVVLLTGSMPTSARRQPLLDLASGDAGIIIGTHALLQDNVQFFDLGLVVVDEQHRFGVDQRNALTSKAEKPPHVLVMTATPIPRTVAMTVFGDLETSTLRELPAGRGDVQTNLVPMATQPAWLDRAWARIREEVASGRQAYVVCSRIGDEPPPEEGPELNAVEEVAPTLAAGALAGLRVQMLHGRMAGEDKDQVMGSFAAGKIDVLVSTTVIEVGVDVANATVMVVLDADRFGVSQLHQLRGRIGRGGHAGLCLLVSHAEPGSTSMDRLTAVAGTRDGFELSRIDLEQRREGNVLGTQQSGRHSALRILSVLYDEQVITEARECASRWIRGDPDLAQWPDLRDAVLDLESTDQADYLEMG